MGKRFDEKHGLMIDEYRLKGTNDTTRQSTNWWSFRKDVASGQIHQILHSLRDLCKKYPSLSNWKSTRNGKIAQLHQVSSSNTTFIPHQSKTTLTTKTFHQFFFPLLCLAGWKILAIVALIFAKGTIPSLIIFQIQMQSGGWIDFTRLIPT